MRRISFLVLLALGTIQVANTTVQQQPDRSEHLAFARFYGDVAPFVERIERQFEPAPELVVTFRRDDLAALRVQAPIDDCALSVWYVPETAPTLGDQISALFDENRNFTVAQVAERVITLRDTRSISCSSSLGRLLRRGAEFAMGIDPKSVPEGGGYVNSEFVSVDVLAGNVRTTIRFPSPLQHPIGAWTRELRVAAEAYIASGFDAR